MLAIALAVVGSKAEGELETSQAPGITNYTRLIGDSGNAGPVVGFGGATKPAEDDLMPALEAEGVDRELVKEALDKRFDEVVLYRSRKSTLSVV